MSEEILCKKLVATYKENNGILGGPHEVEFISASGYLIKIEQCVYRKITVSTKEDTPADNLYRELTVIVRLLMILDGKFYDLEEFEFYDSERQGQRLDGYSSNLRKARQSVYQSDELCSSNDRLIQFDDIITPKLFEEWRVLLTDLDIIHPIYLHSLSATKIPVEIKASFLIEMAESYVELVKTRTNMFSTLNPGQNGTPLKKCLEALIDEYGKDIFAREINTNKDKFSEMLKDSRVRIMHIKRNQTRDHLNPSETRLYIMKLSLMYRSIILQLLGVDEALFHNNLVRIADSFNCWNGTLVAFLNKIK